MDCFIRVTTQRCAPNSVFFCKQLIYEKKTHAKESLISKIFTLAQISKNGCQITPMSTIHLPKLKLLRGSNLAQIFGDFSQGEKRSEIKPPIE